MTAQKILQVASDLIDKINDPTYPLCIVDDKEPKREGAFQISIDILEQKLLLHKGFVCIDFNKRYEAK